MKRRIAISIDDACLQVIDGIAQQRLGIGRSAFIALGAVQLLSQVIVLAPVPKRAQFVAQLREVMQNIDQALENSL